MPDRVIHRLNGPRGSVLLSWALLALVMAISCLPPATAAALPWGLRALAAIVPLEAYALLWLAAAVAAAVGAFRRRSGAVRRGWDTAGFSAVAGLTCGWGLLYGVGWLTEPSASRQWILAGAFLAVAGGVANSARMRNPS